MTSLQVRFKTTPSPEHSTQPCSARIRSRKSHKKSRFGCLHCKERRIKCDEGRPSCSACRRRNVTCSLADAYQTPLAISSGGKAQLLPQESSVIAMPVSFNVLAAALINNSLRREERFPRAFEVDDLKMLQHFKQFTSTTIGNTETQIAYRDVVPRLAAECSYLMDALLAMSILHTEQMYQTARSTPRRAIYHWQQCLSAYTKHVAPVIRDDRADAMLITSTLINGIAFAMLDTTSSENVWPLTTSLNADPLQWLSVAPGINLIFQATQPLPETSQIKNLFPAKASFPPSPPTPNDILRLAPDLSLLCDITPTSDALNNPYITALRLLVPLLFTPLTSSTLFIHLSFIGSVSQSYISFLRQKDHRALLILSYWYANICKYDCWWITLRSRLECRAICTYIERYADQKVVEMLQFPATSCGYTLTRC